MKHLAISLLLIIAAAFSSTAQLVQPVHWKYAATKISDTEAELTITAQIDKSWHLYGMNFAEGGPMRLTISFVPNTNYELLGKPTEVSKPKTVKDPVFGIEVQYFSSQAIFKQKIKLKSTEPFKVSGSLEGQACLDEGQCVMLADDFVITTEGATVQKKKDNETISLTNPTEENATIDTDTLASATSEIIDIEQDTVVVTTQTNKDWTEDNTGKSLWVLFFGAFAAGLLAILTPCVFPMIPMTVSFFMPEDGKPSGGRTKAIVFGLSIIGIYTIIGTFVAVVFGANFANWLSTHWLPNVLFFLVFTFFAASFLGMFEIVLPSSWITKADQRAEQGGLLSPVFMALTLVVVSFSCTGPFVGSILVSSASGMWLQPIIGMLGFALAFALPFTLFAFFPQWLNKMPKSGGWLNSVKVVLGFVELALGLKFLSTADLTYGWGLLDREVYLALWIVIFSFMGLYLLGKLKLAHDTDLPHIGVPRLMLAIAVFSFVLYLLPGMIGAPLKAIAGYLPPKSTQDFDLYEVVRNNAGNTAAATPANETCSKPKYADKLHLPHGLEGYFDYEQALACAREQNKPVFVDFTGHGCVNCREMEEAVWSNPKVLEKLRNDFVVVALYVDDKKVELTEDEWVTSTVDGKVKKTLGAKYADFQISRFKINAQPYYVLLDTEGNILNKPAAYNKNVDNFLTFLNEGLAEFSKRQKK